MRDATRDLRRTYAIITELDNALEAIERTHALEDGPRRRAIAAILHLHLGATFDAASGEIATLMSALDVRTAEVRRLRERVQHLESILRPQR